MPKLAIDRLLFLVGYAADPKGWRQEAVGLDVRDGLVPAVAQALWRQTERALRQGLLQGYRTVEESSHVLRGRLREADQLRRHHGRVIPMEIRHDDFTVDIPENQILLAGEHLQRHARIVGETAPYATVGVGAVFGKFAEAALAGLRLPPVRGR